MAAPADQRRVATVVFADLVGFTTLSEHRDPEQVKNLVDGCFARLASDVTAYGGRVDKIVGDAMVALFGAPVAHEDDAERAVRAALQMQTTLAEHARETGIDVRMRVGVNTGEVLVGAVRASDDYTAMGDVVNVASRLQAAADAGDVIVGPATQAATARVISYERVGPLDVRGRAEPVEAWRAVGTLAPPGYRPRRARSPLVGREHEAGMLRHAVAAAVRRRHPLLLVLHGEAGVGKSHLGEAVAEMAAVDHSAAVLVGRCVPYGEANPWWPVAEVIRQGLGIDAGESSSTIRAQVEAGAARITGREGQELQRVVDGLAHLLGIESGLAEVEPSRAYDGVVDALGTMVAAVAADAPLALFLADVHWADQVVLDLVEDLLDRVRGLPVIVVATARPEIDGRWSPPTGRHDTLVLHLDPLDADATGRLITALLGHGVPDALRDALLERSGGNPFFVEELVALLSEAGVIDGGSGDVEGGLRRIRELPATLRGLVAARLDGMGVRQRALIEDAAVVGRVGSVAALADLATSRGDADAMSGVEDLVALDLLETRDAHYEFKSDLVREVAYETLTKSERARRHAGVGDWLEREAVRTGREDEHLEQLAHHYGLAAELTGDLGSTSTGVPDDVRDRALLWLGKAAQRTEERENVNAAERLYDQALGLLTVDEGERRHELLLGRARTRAWRRDLPGARADLEELLAATRRDGAEILLARALTVLGDVEQREGDAEASLATLEEAMKIARAADDVQVVADAQRRWGMTALFLGRLDDAEQAIADALEAFRRLGDRRSEAWALQNLAWISFSRGDTHLADTRLTESAAMFDEISDWGGRSWALGLLGWVRLAQGRLEEAGDLADEVIDDARRAGDRWALGITLVLQSAVALWLGRTTTAFERSREAREVLDAIGDPFGLSLALATLTRASANLGRVDEARVHWEEAHQTSQALTEAQRLGARVLSANVLCQIGDARAALAATAEIDDSPFEVAAEAFVARGLALVQLGRSDEALTYLDRITDPRPGEYFAMGDEGARTYAYSVTALALAGLGDADGAAGARDAVMGRALGTYIDRVYADLALALVLARRGDPGEATAVLEETLSRVDATEDRLTQAIVRLALGWALLASDDDRATEALSDARSRFAAMGILGDGWETAFALAATGEVPQPAAGP
jgi:class 3 adenylate cyclase/tetratricopeptide (TPR) repeat protein